MSAQYQLTGLKNSELLAGLSELVRQSNILSARVLAHLVELDARMLHLELGFPSLFAYCVEALGMSEGAAGRRVTAARVCRRFSGAFDRIALGELHLSALCALAPHLTTENANGLFDACRGKTRRQIDELLAVWFPRPDVREQIRCLPVRASLPAVATAAGSASPTVDGAETVGSSREVFSPVLSEPSRPLGLTTAPPGAGAECSPAISSAAQSGESSSAAGSTVGSSAGGWSGEPSGGARAERSPPGLSAQRCLESSSAEPRLRRHVLSEPRRPRQIEPLSADRFGVHFTADSELRQLLERARALASHRLPNGDLASLMKLMAISFVTQEEKRRFGAGAKQRRKSTALRHANVAPAAPPGEVAAAAAAPGESSGGETELSGVSPGAPITTELPVGVRACAGGSEARRKPGEQRRYLPVKVRREAHDRDRGQCAFVSANGRRCAASAFLQFDHVQPFARRGTAEGRNIRLLCRAHNLLHARHCFGALHLARKIAAKQHAPDVSRRGAGQATSQTTPRGEPAEE